MKYAPFELSGKVAVVIGGTSGIGRALAYGLAEAGADVVPSSRREDQVEATAKEIEQIGRRTVRVASDVSNRSSLERLLEQTVSRLGKVDILINSAGKTKRTPTLEVPESEWNDIMETNLTGVLRACQIFGRHMIERRYGRIVNIASLSSFVWFRESCWARQSVDPGMARKRTTPRVSNGNMGDLILLMSFSPKKQAACQRQSGPVFKESWSFRN